ncbi:serine/threonine protein phosphatase [Leptotrichia massiliensis]|uniref:serine/threonine protein phosphatase n=1 Tax=Leptotrichia massiliensis TaxID=1852388 RepID=UPI0028D7F850|nr:serine/threonine protein phosphatase [Leptotrichia massiliensis]
MAKQQQQFLYDYRNDHSEEDNNKLVKTAFILFIISALLVAFSHFVLIGKKAEFQKNIPALKENKQKLEKEVEAVNNSIKHSEDTYKKTEALVNKYK